MSLLSDLADAEARADQLRRQVAAASCAEVGHRWKHIGNRNCGCWPTGHCSVPVHECEVCKDCDIHDACDQDEDWKVGDMVKQAKSEAVNGVVNRLRDMGVRLIGEPEVLIVTNFASKTVDRP